MSAPNASPSNGSGASRRCATTGVYVRDCGCPRHRQSRQDRALENHFLRFIEVCAGDDLGPAASRDLRRIIARARATGNMASFGAYIGRLILADAAANGWG